MQKLKKGDEVIVISGKDKGRRGTVLRMMPYQRVLVEGINIAKKHQRPDPARGLSGGIVDQEAPIHISNVMLYNPVTKKGDRVGVKSLEDGRRVRFFKSNGEVVDA